MTCLQFRQALELLQMFEERESRYLPIHNVCVEPLQEFHFPRRSSLDQPDLAPYQHHITCHRYVSAYSDGHPTVHWADETYPSLEMPRSPADYKTSLVKGKPKSILKNG